VLRRNHLPPPLSRVSPYTTLFRSARLPRRHLLLDPHADAVLAVGQPDEPGALPGERVPLGLLRDRRREHLGEPRDDRRLPRGLRARKRPRLNSSHVKIPYAACCLK